MNGEKEKVMSHAEAVKRLTRRYKEQCIMFPLTCLIPLHLYILRNVKHVQRNNLLSAYASEGEVNG